MGIVDRIIITLYTLLLAFLAAAVVLLAVDLLPVEIVWTSIHYIHGRWEAGLIGVLLLLVSLRLFLAGLRSSKKYHETIVHHGERGDILITLDAVENLVEKTARHTRGVRSVKVKVRKNAEVLQVTVKAVISPESHVPTVGAEMQKRIDDYIKNTVGVELSM